MFGSTTRPSVFGGTSTAVFGANSSPLGSMSAFGATLSPAFGSSTAALGAPLAPAFGSSLSSFGGSSLFGQKPAFGGFASRPNQSDSSGSVFQQTQTTFGSNPFGSSTPFDASTQNAFGAGSPPAFGAASTSTFAVASTPTFGSSSTSIFGSTGTAFAVSSAPAFGFGTRAAFGASNTSGTLNTSILGASNTSAFGASSSPAFGTSSTTGFGFGTTPTYGQSTSASGSSSIFEATPSLFGTQSSYFGAQTTMPTFGTTSFGPSAFGGQRGGSRVAAYTATAEVDGGSRTQPAVKLQSLLAMTVYKDKSHEELRLEDYQLGDKGGPCHVRQSAGGFGVGGSTTQSNAFGPSPTLTQSSPNPFSSSVSSNPLAPQTSTPNPFVPQTSTPNPFPTQTPSPNPFATQTSTPNPFALQTSTPNPFPTQTPSPIPFATQTSSPIPFPPQTFSNLLTPQTSSNLSAPQTSSPNPYASQTSSNPFSPQTISNALALQTPYNSFAPKTPAPSSSGSVASSALGFNSLLFRTSSFANTFKTTSSPPCSILTASGPASGLNSCPSLFSSSSSPVLGPSPSIFSSTSALGTASGIGSGLSSANTQSSPAFWSSTQSTVVGQPAPVVSPFGALPAMPQLSIAHPGSTPSIRYGISSMPVFDKPAAPVRLSSLLTSRHLSQRRIRLPARKYDPKSDGPKVPFFSNDGEMPTAPKAGTLFVPRENPRALVINPAEQWPQRPNNEKMSPLLRASYVHIYNNGSVSENSADKEGTSSIKSNHKPNDPCNITFTEKEALHIITSTGCKAGEAAILQEQETDVEALMPRLQHSEYYTEPQIHELAVKERAEPGFCCRVRNFVVGRHGYGNIKFLGDTDVRQLDLDSHIHFDNCELTVYMDESKKPPVGQGLNKPAEVTLLNIKCIDKKTGKQYINGPKVDKYREMLMKKAIEQGAEFVSYDPVKWEWKFRVQHF
ncbi:unnamed protein product [Camellia sinensis]